MSNRFLFPILLGITGIILLTGCGNEKSPVSSTSEINKNNERVCLTPKGNSVTIDEDAVLTTEQIQVYLTATDDEGSGALGPSGAIIDSGKNPRVLLAKSTAVCRDLVVLVWDGFLNQKLFNNAFNTAIQNTSGSWASYRVVFLESGTSVASAAAHINLSTVLTEKLSGKPKSQLNLLIIGKVLEVQKHINLAMIISNHSINTIKLQWFW